MKAIILSISLSLFSVSAFSQSANKEGGTKTKTPVLHPVVKKNAVHSHAAKKNNNEVKTSSKTK